jgi:hypothetical protein
MNGNTSFREALKNRLDIIRPSLTAIEEYNKIQENLITPKARYLLLRECLLFKKKNFYA